MLVVTFVWSGQNFYSLPVCCIIFVIRYLLAMQQKAAAQFRDISEAQLSVSLAVSDVLKTKAQVHCSKYQFKYIFTIMNRCLL